MRRSDRQERELIALLLSRKSGICRLTRGGRLSELASKQINGAFQFGLKKERESLAPWRYISLRDYVNGTTGRKLRRKSEEVSVMSAVDDKSPSWQREGTLAECASFYNSMNEISDMRRLQSPCGQVDSRYCEALARFVRRTNRPAMFIPAGATGRQQVPSMFHFIPIPTVTNEVQEVPPLLNLVALGIAYPDDLIRVTSFLSDEMRSSIQEIIEGEARQLPPAKRVWR